MKAAFFIAKRYFLSKKKRGFINVISIISMLSITFSTAALVIVLSALNGMEGLLRSMFISFDPDLVIVKKVGKSFQIPENTIQQIKQSDGVRSICHVVEDNALLKYKDKQMIVRMKGVEQTFIQYSGFDNYIIYGNFLLADSSTQYILLGRGVQFRLSVDMEDSFFPLQLIYPKNKTKISLSPEKAFNSQLLQPSSVFAIEKQYDDNYVFVPIEVAKELMDYQNKFTSIEIYTQDHADIEQLKRELKKLLGNEFNVLDSDEQHSSLLKAVKIEKLFVYIVFTLIVAIASFSIFLSLTMLVLEKKRDIHSLYYMGADKNSIQQIFMWVGALVALVGAVSGLILGLLICWAQSTFGLVSMGMQTSVVDAYPVKIFPSDLVLCFFTITIIAILASIGPARKATSLIELKN